MTIGFVVYIIWLLSAALLFILLNNIGTLIILIVSAVVPAALIILTAVAARSIRITVQTDYSARKNEPMNGTVTVSNKSMFPA
jgi:RsiW-degrading membrane proteinase PrsW (M82 family)